MEETQVLTQSRPARSRSHRNVNRMMRASVNASRVMSIIFTPFYLPLVGMIALFSFSYLSLLPISYKLFVLLIVYLCTILIPTMLIHFYRKYQGWSMLKLITREGRMVPYVISIMCYFLCFYILNYFHCPHFMSSIVIAALIIQILCATINVWFKISTHTTAIGGFTGSLLAFAELFVFNPLWWLCVLLILAGLVGTGRMILRQHSLHEVVYGYLMGTIVSIIMGSTSDLPVMEKAMAFLNDQKIPFEVNALSAHRTPDAVEAFARGAEERGIRVIIAAAGMAAALPGVIAASTTLPVIGVPIKGMLDGLDAMLSIIQMPPGIPVATVGVNGAMNAAILAMEMLALSDADIAARLKEYKSGLGKKIEKANKDLAEVKYEFKVN